MFTVLFITFSGIALGYLMRRMKWLSALSRSISWTIWLLLFFFGLQVGANEQVVSNLDTLGLKALVISAAGSLGSCIVAWALYKFVFSKGGLPLSAEELQENSSAGQPQENNPVGQFQGKDSAGEPQQENITVHSQDKSFGWGQFLGGFVVVAFFAAGCVCGWLSFLPQWLTDGDFSMYVLYLLMIQVGISIGSDKRLKEILISLRPKLLLLPIGTIVGTLIFAAAISLFISDMSLADSLAVGAGFGYYSLSSVLITQIKEPQVGAVIAAQLGTIALMANIMREVMTLLFSPLLYRVFGKLAPISIGGATSLDSTLPVITSVCGTHLAFISIFHGVLVDFSVPFLVTFFASL